MSYFWVFFQRHLEKLKKKEVSTCIINHVLFQFFKKEHSKAVDFTHKCSLGFQDQLLFGYFEHLAFIH